MALSGAFGAWGVACCWRSSRSFQARLAMRWRSRYSVRRPFIVGCFAGNVFGENAETTNAPMAAGGRGRGARRR